MQVGARWRTRAAAWVLLTSLALVALVALDLSFTGPYVRWFNARHKAEATRMALIGKSESEIVKVFGKPSRVDDAPRAYAYYPCVSG